MRRHFAQPWDVGTLHRDVWVEAAGDGVGDGGLTLFGQQCQQLFLLSDQRVDLGGFAVEEIGDSRLLVDWQQR